MALDKTQSSKLAITTFSMGVAIRNTNKLIQ